MVGIDQSKLFSALNAGELALLKQSALTRKVPAGDTIFQEGDQGDGLYVVSEGLVKISALLESGDRRVLAKAGPGDFFGEMAVLDQEPRSASAVAEEDSVVHFIPREKLLGMIESSPRLAVKLVREFSLRMRDFNRQYISEVLQAERLALVGRFARSIVHDFKNPLNIIGLAAELMDMDKASPEMRKSTSLRIRKQVERLTNMINELLEFTRGPQHTVILAPVDYHKYVTELLTELETELKDRDVAFIFENEPPAVPVLMDSKRIMHVFNNLVNNAVDAMGEGGKVIFRFRTSPKEIITEVEDTGPGLAPEIQERLFEAFATYGKAKGTGLGLSICKKVIEDHRGWIKAGNSAAGGAVFSFALPIAPTR